MKWYTVLEAIAALPSIILDQLVSGSKMIYTQEKELIAQGEYDPEDEIEE